MLPPGLHFPKGCPLRRRPPAPPLLLPLLSGPPTDFHLPLSKYTTTGFPPSLFFSSCPPLTFPTYSATSTHAPGLKHACWLTDVLPSSFKAHPSVLCSICITEHPPGSGAGEGGKTGGKPQLPRALPCGKRRLQRRRPKSLLPDRSLHPGLVLRSPGHALLWDRRGCAPNQKANGQCLGTSFQALCLFLPSGQSTGLGGWPSRAGELEGAHLTQCPSPCPEKGSRGGELCWVLNLRDKL